ncbi:transcriptional regulator, AsnC family [Archaeoglobus sulfaticallidus PM70-1]|uniref:siroheme decarboxylase n=1 Tax=Archaeoglobus sulfaticallidus PM70-1 TaxID=387631 RepID=N0BJH8_9EURY|nr:Lrp/AsnC family transcriptional regulator [Archaeoglobus sulfaticallidus]AGK60631.1 transcriptional regulator, AsnC family [Archaeoglobus sulfaticallidus PM70-1]
MFDDREKALLMALQYNFPLSEEPYIGISEFTGLDLDYVLRKTKEFLEKGIIKRIGAQLNYKAFRDIGYAVLVGAKADRVDEVAAIINSFKPKHNYLRDCEEYNIWFTIKSRDIDALRAKVEEIVKAAGIADYVFLPSKRVYKMDVKYDLLRGISYSEAGLERMDVPKVEELGVDPELLRALEREFPVQNRPFKVYERFGYGEGELISLIEEMIDERVIRGFYAVLKERKIGFRENGMNLIRTEKPKKVALKLVREFPEITHLVERVPDEKWNYPLYFMVHAVSRSSIEEIKSKAAEMPGVEEIRTLYSIRDLNPNYRY